MNLSFWYWNAYVVVTDGVDRLKKRSDRGDVPGWVLVTLMSALLAVTLVTFLRQPLKDALQGAINKVKGA